MPISNVWLQALLTVGVALVVSMVSLLYRYRQKGHPFGSLAAGKWAIFVIVVTAAPAVLALILPHLPPASAYVGAAVPAVLVVRGDRLHERRKPTEDAGWYRVATLGVTLLLDRLEQQMDTDRDNWVNPVIAGLTTMQLMEDFAENLHSALEGRTGMVKHRNALRSHRDAVLAAAKQARAAGPNGINRDYRQAVHSAKKALSAMLQLTYNCGHQSAVSTATARAIAVGI